MLGSVRSVVAGWFSDHFGVTESCVLLFTAIVICSGTIASVTKLAVIKHVIPDWAVSVPLSWAGSAGPSKVVFRFGLTLTALLSRLTAPVISDVYTSILLDVSGAHTMAVEICKQYLLWLISAMVFGLVFLAVVTLNDDASRQLRENASLRFDKRVADKVHFVAANTFFTSAFLLWLAMLNILYIAGCVRFLRAEVDCLALLVLAVLKCVFPCGAACFAIFFNRRRFLTLDLPLLQRNVILAGIGQSSALIAIRAFLGTICVDIFVLGTLMKSADAVGRDDNSAAAWLRVPVILAVSFLSLGAVVAFAFRSADPQQNLAARVHLLV